MRILKKLKELAFRSRVNLLAFLILLLAASVSLQLLQRELLKNAYELGNSLANGYALEEQNKLTVYETVAELASESVDSRLKEEKSTQELVDWIAIYKLRLQKILGASAVDIYAVKGDKLLHADAWKRTNYDHTKAEWYQKAMGADGEVVFTNAYADQFSGRKVITVAQKCRTDDVVVGIDIVTEEAQLIGTSLELPEGASFFLCDSNGKLIYHDSHQEHTEEELQRYVDRILEKIQNGELDDYASSITSMEGEQRGVYYKTMDIGWTSIVTLSREDTLQNLRRLMWSFTLVFVALLAVFLVLALRDEKSRKKVARINETIQALSNFYYAIYRVNLSRGTYEMIKSIGFMGRQVERSGAYSELMEAILQVIQEDAREDYQKSFSIENVQNLVDNHVRDYGGDFLRRFEEGYRWVNVRVLYDMAMASDEVVLCFREVDQEKQAQLQERHLLKTSLQSMQKSERSKQAFFRNMSHDMRTPLNAIIGLTELATLSLDQPEKASKYLERISASGQQLLTLINEILELSRLEQGRLELDNRQLDLRKCLEECVATFRIQAEREDKRFVVSIQLEDNMVLGDFFRINEIMNNLLSNAFKFTSPGDTVTVKARQVERQGHISYKIVVSDTGVGLSPEFMPHLFDPYARETRFGAKRVTGTGLGMSIVKSLITQMSGNIYVDSTLGEGTTFTIILPLAVVAQDQRQVQAEEEQQPQAQEVPLEKWHILLAEDNSVNMEIATELLSMSGLRVTQAWNGLEAVDHFRTEPPFTFDAILMDMQMPEMDGCEAAREIRRLVRPDAKTVPIIAVTANAFAEDVAATSEAGMDAHISKPIDYAALIRTLRDLINRDKETST